LRAISSVAVSASRLTRSSTLLLSLFVRHLAHHTSACPLQATQAWQGSPPFTRRGVMESVVVAPFAPRAESQFWAHAPAADNEFASTDDAGEEMGWSRPQDVWAAPSTPSSRATTSATSQLSSQGSGNEILGGAPQTVADSVSATASLWATTPPMASSPQNHSRVGSDQYE
jgi:hypothetical protein